MGKTNLLLSDLTVTFVRCSGKKIHYYGEGAIEVTQDLVRNDNDIDEIVSVVVDDKKVEKIYTTIDFLNI